MSIKIAGRSSLHRPGWLKAELKAELAITLVQQQRLTLGQAALLADVPQFSFQGLLADRRIPVHYDLASSRTSNRLAGARRIS